jgi:molybdopterin-guanine dinucleotide biosynthesis protein B
MHELRGEREPTLAELVPHLAQVDLVIVEGFKAERHVKLEVHRSAVGKPLLYPNDAKIVAVASDTRPENSPLPFADLNDVEAVADLVEELARPFPP